MDGGILTWLLGQAKDAGAIAPVAVAALAAVVVLWRMHVQDRKTILDLNRTLLTISREGTKAQLATARVLAKLSAKMERKNGR